MDSEFLGDILECSVCLKPLDEQNKVLPCQHTFCKSCLHSIVRSHKELRCPECRVVVRQKVDELPSNILLIRLLDGIKSQEKKFVEIKVDTRRHSVEGILTESVVATGGAKDAEKTGLPQSSKIVSHERTNSEPVVQKTLGKPRAKALFDYNSTLPSDLSFSKGDTIFLLKKIDENWMSGECNSHIGVFPSNFVKIIHPLPVERAICVALFDFDSTSDDQDRDCLKFQKNEVILLIRRVDENWVEGMIRDKIGIFPLSFVQLNDKAKILLDDMSLSSEGKGHHKGAAARRIESNKHGKNTKKRHSFPTFYASKQKENFTSHRHSMELEASSSSRPLEGINNTRDVQTPAQESRTNKIVTPTTQAASGGARASSNNSSGNNITSTKLPQPSSNKNSSDKISSTSSVSKLLSPNKIVTASYSYQAQKPDELTLIKGESFKILEVCNDGWCRGLNLKTKQIGAIPGNYITPNKVNKTPPATTSKPLLLTPRPMTSSSLTPRSLTLGSVNPRPLASSLVTPKALTPGSVTPKALTSGSVTPKALTSGSVTLKALTSSLVIQRPSTTSSVTPRPSTSKVTLPKERTYQQFQQQQKDQQQGKVPSKIPPPRPAAPKSTNQQGSATKSTNQQKSATKSGNQQNTATNQQNSKKEKGNLILKMISGGAKKSPKSPPTRSRSGSEQNKPNVKPLTRDRYYAVMDYPASDPGELSLKEGDIVAVHRRDPYGWFEGTLQRSGKTGLFPATFLKRVPE